MALQFTLEEFSNFGELSFRETVARESEIAFACALLKLLTS